MILECQYQKANRYKAEKDYETAADIYFSIEDFKSECNVSNPLTILSPIVSFLESDEDTRFTSVILE